jgi:hypothetical protein
MVVSISNVVVATDTDTIGVIPRRHMRNVIHRLVSAESLRHEISVCISYIRARRRM